MDINDKAPDFTLPDQNGEEVSLEGLSRTMGGSLFLPPRRHSRLHHRGLRVPRLPQEDGEVGAVVLGISPDTSKAQKKFEEKFDLPFTLLADADKKVCNLYGVIQEKNMYGKKVMGVVRTTFIIGPDGKIKHIFNKVKAEGHAEEVLAYLKSAAKGAA